MAESSAVIKLTGRIPFDVRTFDDGTMSYKVNVEVPTRVVEGSPQYQRVTYAVREAKGIARQKGDLVTISGYVFPGFYISKQTGKPVGEVRIQVIK